MELYPHQVKAWTSDRRVIALVGGTGSGKCVNPTDRIILADGSVAAAESLVGSTFSLLTINTDGKQVATEARAEWNITEPVFRITTERGREITRSANHPLWTAWKTRNSKQHLALVDHQWTETSALEPGQAIAVTAHLRPEVVRKLPEWEVKLLAYIIGDGGCTRNTVVFSQLPGRQLDEFSECCEKIGCRIDKVKYGTVDYLVTRISDRLNVDHSPVPNPIVEMLKYHGVMGVHARAKKVPDEIFGLTDDLIAIFLSRLYSTDGWISKAQIGYSSASKQLIQDVQLLLLRFGVQSSIETKKTSWTLSVRTAEDVRAFAGRIGVFGKQDAMDRELGRINAADSAREASAYGYGANRNAWRKLDLPSDLSWETVKSVEELPPVRTVAIAVPETNTFLTMLYEHNTWMAPRWIYSKLIRHAGARCLCIGLGYDKHVDRVMIRETETFLKSLGAKYALNKKLGIIELSNGSQMLFGSADNPLSLEGAHLEYCWIDEAGMMGVTTFEVAQRRTGIAWGQGMGQILITTIPYFDGWLKREICDLYYKGDPSIEWIKCASKDNPQYPREEIERMKRKNYTKYLIFYEGQWAQTEGLIFPEPSDDDLVVDPFIIPDHWPAYAGHDYGWNDPTTGVWGRHDEANDILYIVADYEANKQTIDDHVYAWDDLGLTYVDEAFGDPANPEVWARVNAMGYPVVTGINRMSYTLDCVNDRLLTGRLKVFRGCRKLLDYRRRYIWATKNEGDDDVFTDKPKDPQPARHMMDGLRYLCAGLAESGRGAPPDPSIAFLRRKF